MRVIYALSRPLPRRLSPRASPSKRLEGDAFVSSYHSDALFPLQTFRLVLTCRTPSMKKEDVASDLGAVVPLQMIAYELAMLKDNNPDAPRHLRKIYSDK